MLDYLEPVYSVIQYSGRIIVLGCYGTTYVTQLAFPICIGLWFSRFSSLCCSDVFSMTSVWLSALNSEAAASHARTLQWIS